MEPHELMEQVMAVVVIPIPIKAEEVMAELREAEVGAELIRIVMEAMVREAKFVSGCGKYG